MSFHEWLLSLEALSPKGSVGLKFALARHIGIATTRDARRYESAYDYIHDLHEDVCVQVRELSQDGRRSSHLVCYSGTAYRLSVPFLFYWAH
jgi:hypothetical protein